MTTEKCLDFLLRSLAANYSSMTSDKKDWTCLKKYKNFQGFTCRDFFNEKKNLKMIVVHIPNKDQLTLIENQNFLYFLKDESVQPLFAYAPFVSADGLVFLFCINRDFNEKQMINFGGSKLIETLTYKLNNIFSDKNIVYLESSKMVLILNHELNYIAEKLEQNNFKLNTHIFTKYENAEFYPVFPDMNELKYHFPEDENKSSIKAIETIFSLISINILTDEIHTRIKKLLRRVSLEDLRLSKKIAMDLNEDQKIEIKKLFEKEIEYKKNTTAPR